MADEKYGNMPNNSSRKTRGSDKFSDTDSGKMGSNHGATGGLKKSSEMRADVVKTPTTDNRYPDGLA